jgi:hypothetical protein
MHSIVSSLVLLLLAVGASATPRRMMLSTEAATATDGLHEIHSTEAATETDGLHGLHTTQTFGVCAGAAFGCPMDSSYFMCWPGSTRWVSHVEVQSQLSQHRLLNSMVRLVPELPSWHAVTCNDEKHSPASAVTDRRKSHRPAACHLRCRFHPLLNGLVTVLS